MIINKEQLVQSIENDLSDNSTGQISPVDIRHNLLDLIDSVHLLTEDANLNALNFGTPDLRNVRIGTESLASLNLDGYTSTDNIAIGHGSLRSSYRTQRNTAIGSYALSCNIHGDGNLALGYNSLAGNTTGFSNVALGAHALNNNKIGHFNIALGNGAGYYIARDDSYKFFLASHPIDEDYICANPNGSGLVPTMFGDLQQNIIGINTRTLHSDGILQTSGNITPSTDGAFDLGSQNYNWRNLRISNILFTPSGLINSNSRIDLQSPNIAVSGDVSVSGNLFPSDDETYYLGLSDKKWDHGYFNQLIANALTAFQKSFFSHKTLYLASSGDWSIDGGGPSSLYEYYPCPNATDISSTLSDNEIVGGGFVLKSINSDYEFTFQNSNYPCGTNNRRWYSNIGIELDGASSYISAAAFVASLSNSCFGIYVSGSQTFLADKSDYVANSGYTSGDLNVYRSITSAQNDFDFILHSLGSGIDISQKFMSSRSIPKQQHQGKDIINGFELKYHDDKSVETDRFSISSYNDSAFTSNSVNIMCADTYGIMAISNLLNSDTVLPTTTLNIRSSNDAIIRSTSENYGSYKSALQLLAHQNCLNSGVEFVYTNHSGIFDLNIYDNFNKTTVLSSPSGISLGIFASGDPFDLVTIGNPTLSNAVVSVQQTTLKPSMKDGYGKLYVYEKIAPLQSQTVLFLDDEGNEHQVIRNPLDPLDGLVYSFAGSTFAGICPDNRGDTPQAIQNTAYGYAAMNEIVDGRFNTSYGWRAADTLTSGNYNVAVGHGAMINCGADVEYNIAIGCSSVGDSISDDYNFVLGANNSNLLFEGKLGPSAVEKHLYMPDGKLTLYGANKTEGLHLANNIIRVEDFGGSDNAENNLTFKFKGNVENDLVIMDHSDDAMTNNPSYFTHPSGRPFVEVNGDIKLRGGVAFSDTTFLDTATEINKIPSLEDTLTDIFIEGFANEAIASVTDIESPTSGIMTHRDGRQFTITNRDKYAEVKVNDYIIAIKMNGEYRPIWISNPSSVCNCCTP